MHILSKHHDRYDFEALIKCVPALKTHVFVNKFGDITIDFSKPEAVKLLNSALLHFYYNVSWWDIPKNYLCPPIPGRADYIHYLADILIESKIENDNIRVLDIGTGANCIYPLIGCNEYDWQFVASDIDQLAIESAQTIVTKNSLSKMIEVRLQNNKDLIFTGVIQLNEHFHLTTCNPPFHASFEDAKMGTDRKNKNLGLKKNNLNFAGQGHELWCEGGEVEFIKKMIAESLKFKGQILWFTTLVSKKENVDILLRELKKKDVVATKVIDMNQGQKISRIITWTYIPIDQHKKWKK